MDVYDGMIARGILDENDRVELIRGEIVEKMTIGDRHAACVKRLNALFQTLSQGRWIVGVQDPVAFEDSQPEPDLARLQPRGDFYTESNLRASDILRVIEVADRGLDFDRDVKRPLYAEAGVSEYWIVNLTDSCVEIHRGPRSAGTYTDSQTVAQEGTVSFQGLDLTVVQLF